MSNGMKSILKNPTPPEWKEADEIVSNLWLGTITNNEQAWKRGITEIICISKDPYADLQREGFTDAPHLDTTIFRIANDNKGNLLPIFSEVCDAIERTLQGGERLLMWDIGGGVAALAAYIMKRYAVSLPEAMTDITRARLRRAKPTPLPSKRIIDMLNNENYLLQLEMWQACGCNLFENTIRNPTEPREKWIVEKVRESPQQKIKGKMKEKEEEEEEEDDDDDDDEKSPQQKMKGKMKEKDEEDDDEDEDSDDDIQPVRKDKAKRPQGIYLQPDHERRSTSHLSHRLGTISEVEQEAHRLSIIAEEVSTDEEDLIDEDDVIDEGGVYERSGYFGFEIPGMEEKVFERVG